VSSSIGKKIGIVHVGIFYFRPKFSKNLASVRIAGGSFQDDKSYLQQVD